jgi:hypothetical protein
MHAPQQIAELVLDHTLKMVLKPLYDIYICISAIIFGDDCRRLASSSRGDTVKIFATIWYFRRNLLLEARLTPQQYTHCLFH